MKNNIFLRLKKGTNQFSTSYNEDTNKWHWSHVHAIE